MADLHEVLGQARGDVAALIAEPIQGVGGFTSPPDGLFGAFGEVLRRARHPVDQRRGADRLGPHRRALLGLAGARPERRARTSLTFAKGIGNGMSIGGVVARAEIMDCLGANSISTFGGSPVTVAGALANLRYLLEHDLQGNAAASAPCCSTAAARWTARPSARSAAGA